MEFINSMKTNEYPEDNREFVDIFGTHWIKHNGWTVATGKIDYKIKCSAPGPLFSNSLYWKYV